MVNVSCVLRERIYIILVINNESYLSDKYILNLPGIQKIKYTCKIDN